MTSIDKNLIHFIQNGEAHESKVYNRPVNDLADEAQRGFDLIDQDIIAIDENIDDMLVQIGV
tara:strand:- start:2715 stop:2900 length:186 start_codon:yes stop_codon:yes gene_type:complete